MLLSLQEIVRGGITVSGVFNYRLTPELSIAVCYADSPITVGYCVGIYDEWPDNRIVLDTWYQFRSIRWCKAWGVPYVSLHGHIFLYDQVQGLLCAYNIRVCTVFHEALIFLHYVCMHGCTIAMVLHPSSTLAYLVLAFSFRLL